jgi:F0F1-type ATP synthase membrane subunit c/vacuolar-type H+-ATPase subunit K
MGLFLLIGVAMLAAGVAIINANNDAVEVTLRYDDQCPSL